MSATLRISGWGVLSSAGVGADSFTAGLAAGPAEPALVKGLFEEELPGPRAHALVDFDVKQHLGRKGTTFLDRSTALAMVACGQALADSDLVVADAGAERVGIALGTTTGSLRATSDYSKETLVNDRPYLVNPLLFPNTVMNCAAGQSAIRYKLRGVNATLAGGPLAALTALRYARNTLSRGYADAMLVGSVEEFSPHTAWLAEHQNPQSTGRLPLGEGAAVFMVEAGEPAPGSGRRPADAEVLAVEVGQYAPPGELPSAADGLAVCIERALASAGVDAADVRLVATGQNGVPALDEVEDRALSRTVPGAERLAVKRFTGETQAASGALQIAAVLAGHRADPALDGRLCLVTSCSPEGAVGAALLRGWSRAGR